MSLTAPRRRSMHAAAIATMLALAIALGVPSSTFAYWSAESPTLTASAPTGTVPVAPQFTCTSEPGLAPYVRLTWNAPAITPPSTGIRYEVWLRSADGSTRSQITRADPTTRAQEIRAGLSDLLGGLTDLLLGGKPIYAEVITVHPSGWRSQPTAGKPIVRTGLLPGLLGGLKCH